MKTKLRRIKRPGSIHCAMVNAIVFGIILLVVPISVSAIDDFLRVTGPCGLSFPSDHGHHPDYRTEWWYYTGHLIGADDRRYGFQLTFFRIGLTPPSARRNWPSPASPWRTDQIYMAHAAVTDITAGRHLQAEKMVRPVLSMGGAAQNGPAWKIHAESWQAVISPGQHHLKADTTDFSFDLNLSQTKPLVLHGNDGYSRKGQAPERASCYYSFTRLDAAGRLSIGNVDQKVSGVAWMDHEFSTALLETGISGWDWFSLQLSDRTEFMFYLLRQADGTLNPASSGTYVLPSGKARHLVFGDVQITPVAHWQSPQSGARYPVQWQVSIPALNYRLMIKANPVDQEMRTPNSTDVVYWEGSVDITGTNAGKSITGQGYVEMTGYAEPFDIPM